jgi:NAD(P)H-dependent flavin oxidoreductase YrpB (nitropropane dioxygenase family)
MADALATALTRRLGCRLPVIQTAMGWIATPALVAASSNAGAFGFLAGAVMKPAELADAVARLKDMTPHNFGVNFHSFQPGAAEIVEIILANADRVRAVSFGRGPDAKMIGRFRDAGILCIPTVGAVKHAEKMVQLGCDMITVQGGEGGGHTGSVPTTVLLPQVLDSVDVPVVAAGGFGDGRGLAAALAYGAAGIAMGTRFLMTAESPVPDAPKAAYVKAGTGDIVVSTKVDGIPQRMILNPLLRRIEGSGKLGMWLRAVEAGLEMKRQTGMGWGEVIRRARHDCPRRDAACPGDDGRRRADDDPARRRFRRCRTRPDGHRRGAGRTDLPTCRPALANRNRGAQRIAGPQPFVSSEVETPARGISTSLEANGG